MKTYRIKLIEEAKKEFDALDKSQRKLILKQLIKLEVSPYYGKHLGKKIGIDLSGFYKLYADKKKLRIIYTIRNDYIVVISIGKRDDFEVYAKAAQRIEKYKNLKKD